HGRGLLLQCYRLEGRAIHGQRVQSELERLPSTRARQTRRQLRRHDNACQTGPMSDKRLGVGFVGSGFNARFHMQGWRGVRDADVLGVWSPRAKNAEGAAQLAREVDVGKARVYKSIAGMVEDPTIDAI